MDPEKWKRLVTAEERQAHLARVAAYPAMWRDWAFEDVQWLFHGMDIDVKGKRVLDLGMGRGHAAAALAKNGADVTGVDLNDYRDSAASHIPLLIGDIGRLEQIVKPGSVDLAVSWHVWPYLLDPVAALGTVYDVLAVGGMAVIDVTPLYRRITEPPLDEIIAAHFPVHISYNEVRAPHSQRSRFLHEWPTYTLSRVVMRRHDTTSLDLPTLQETYLCIREGRGPYVLSFYPFSPQTA
jgi:SAM-dependent methyltransferase